MESKGALSRPLQYGSDKLKLEQQLPQSSPLQSTYGMPMPLNLNCKVFLSHSGCDKEFVRFLYAALCSRYHDKEVGFFDEETLPTATAISMKNILEEARRSQLGVLVLTEDFFVQTPNPMRELEAFMLGEVRLLPLFFGMSVEEFKKKIQSRSWEDQWRKWFIQQSSGRSDVEDRMESWRRCLSLVTAYSGLERKKSTNDLEYIKKTVDEVTKVIPPTIFLSKKGVCGKNRLCQMVNNMFKKCVAKHTSSIDRTPIEAASTSTSSSLNKEEYKGYTTSDLVGIFGFSGLGKTTLCECLCEFYFAEFSGRVYYVDVGSSGVNHASSQKHLVPPRLNTSSTNDFLHSQVNVKDKFLFSKQLSLMKDPIFLAIDNILSDTKSQEEAEFYLRCEFSKGSKILITSKSESILTNLASLQSCNFFVTIEYMPALDFEEARDIFVREFLDFHKHGFSDLEDDVNECVRMCTIHERRYHRQCYHPLMLKSLAASLKWDRSISNLDWRKRLMRLRLKGITNKENAWEKMFDMFDEAYALLSENIKKVFLNMALFYSATPNRFQTILWIKMLYSHLPDYEMNNIILRLQDLCFLQETTYGIAILDLLVDFGKTKARQGVFPEYLVRDSANWVADLPRRARTVSIAGCGQHDMNKSWALDLRAVKDVEVLHIVGNPGLQKVRLSGITCARLRSLILRVPAGASLICTCEQEWPGMSGAETGEGLQWVEIEGDVCFRLSRLSEGRSEMSALSSAFFSSLRNLEITSAPDIATDLVSTLGGLRNLEVLRLSQLPGVQSIDVATCANLKQLYLSQMPWLESISGLKQSNLDQVFIYKCKTMLLYTIPADLKTVFYICLYNSLEREFFAGAKPSYDAGAHSASCHERPAIANVDIDGLSQYTGSIRVFNVWHKIFSEVTRLRDLLKLIARFDSSLCKAQIRVLELTSGCNQERLNDAKPIDLHHAQDIGVFITTLMFKAQPESLEKLVIRCKEGGDSVCNQNAPLFGSLPMPHRRNTFTMDTDVAVPLFYSQVKDLASLFQWYVPRSLDLMLGLRQWDALVSIRLGPGKRIGVELVWPDFFITMITWLECLSLSYTSNLREWPTGVLLGV